MNAYLKYLGLGLIITTVCSVIAPMIYPYYAGVDLAQYALAFFGVSVVIGAAIMVFDGD